MINCPNCGTENRDGSKFCNDCGQPLGDAAGITCTMCGAQNPAGSEYCGECGARLVLLDSPADTGDIVSDAATIVPPVADAMEDAGLPDWLDRLRSAAQDGTTGETDDLPAIVPDTPLEVDERPVVDPFVPADTGEPADDWLSQLRKSAQMDEEEDLPAVEPFVAEPEEPTIVEMPAPVIPVDDDAGELDELPDWLSQLRTGLQEESDQEAIPEPAADEPEPAVRDTGGLAWLDEVVLGEVVPAAPEEEDDEGAPATADEGAETLIADELSEPTIVAPERDIPPIFSADSDELPGEPTKWDSQEFPSLEAATEIPDWLQEMGPLAGESESLGDLDAEAPDTDSAPFAGEELEPAILPDWLQPGTGESAGALDDIAAAEDTGGLAKADIPDWLVAMRPDAGAAQQAEYAIEAGDLEEDGVLAGLHDVIPIELSVATPPDTSRLGGLLGVLPEDEEGAGRFAEVVETVAPARPVPRVKERRFSVPRLVLALLLLLVIAVPMVTDFRFFDSTPVPGADADTASAIIDTLAPGDAVVVAYDFDPSTAGEMEPLADTLVDHAMQRDARIIAVSLLPAGPAMAQRSMERVAELHPEYGYGGLFVNLGYLPGKEAALRSFLADPFGPERIDFVTGKDATTLPGLSGLSSLDDVKLIIELGSSTETVRWWVEQIGSQTDVKILAGVSAAVDPQIRPYYESTPQQIDGLVSGLAGAAEYEVLIAGQRISTGEIEALRWATVFVLLVILAGIVVSPFVRRTDGGKS